MPLQMPYAPPQTTCVSAVRKVLERCSNRTLPPLWIGDMPRILVEYGSTVHRVDVASMQPGDLIFLRLFPNNKIRKTSRFISHIMVASRPGEVFHCSEHRGKAVVESLAFPIDTYAQQLLKRPIDDPALFLRYIDPRNEKLRKKFGTELVPFPVPRPIPHHPFPPRIRKIIAQYLVTRIDLRKPEGLA